MITEDERLDVFIKYYSDISETTKNELLAIRHRQIRDWLVQLKNYKERYRKILDSGEVNEYAQLLLQQLNFHRGQEREQVTEDHCPSHGGLCEHCNETVEFLIPVFPKKEMIQKNVCHDCWSVLMG